MPNFVTKTLRESMIEENKLDIPYDSIGFVNWLLNFNGYSTEDAKRQVQLIRDADIELYQPGDADIFRAIAEWIEQAKETKFESIRSLNHDFVFISLITQIEYLQDMEASVSDESLPFLNEVIEAYKLYRNYLMDSLCYSYEQLERCYVDAYEDSDGNTYCGEIESVNTHQKYDSIPLEDEFNEYIIDSRFSQDTRYKMLSNLRKFNSLIINNGRGDSDWLQRLADNAKAGINIRYARLKANILVHNVMDNIDETSGINISELRGSLTALNHYINFLIHTYGKELRTRMIIKV